MRLSNRKTYEGMSSKMIRSEMSEIVSRLYKKSKTGSSLSHWDYVTNEELSDRLDELETFLSSSLEDSLDREFVVNMEDVMNEEY